MATFIMLSRLSPEGMRTLRDNPQRIQEVNREVEEFGARVVQQYALLGSHDFITVLEAPDAETVSRVSVELSSRATASYETLPAIDVEAFVARLRGEGGRAQEEAPRPTSERSGGTARPMETAASEPPPREQAEADLEDIKEDIRREDGPRRRTEVGSPRTEEASPQGRERAGRPETGREEDRGLLDKARDALTGQEEEPRREGPGNGREEPQRREPPRGAQGDGPLR
jgi:uncharacterized protein with GYD domain